MIGWLIETLVWTGALIALVLLVRRPVARWFGPGVAYALWALPALRLVMPPIVLPAWMGASEAAPVAALPSARAPDMVLLASAEEGTAFAAPSAAPPLGATPASEAFALDPALMLGSLLGLWLIGALAFLILRYSAYFRLRDELLASAREVGRHGKVRLLETPAIDAPLAFGVFDKVIALPQGFLAQPDRMARDLALAHEFAHHEARDLLVNILVQPLFALHWWSPLGHYGWLALRRDQEAACDARVIAARPPAMREAYANLIVSFAAGPRIALAAPMACPVLGEKSIIHRLRSLSMSQTSTTRRRTGLAVLGAAILALPLTATISYAATRDGIAAPQPPAAPVPPAPPTGPGAVNAPPVSPVPAPPAPPAPPAVLQSGSAILEIDPDTEAEIERSEQRAQSAMQTAERAEERARTQQRRAWMVHGKSGFAGRERQLSDQEMDEMLAGMRAGLEEANRVMAELPAIIEQALAESEAARAAGMRTMVRMDCDDTTDAVSETIEADDGTTVVRLCQSRIMEQARKGLKQARAEIARSRDFSHSQQKRILRELDRQIDQWDRAAR